MTSHTNDSVSSPRHEQRQAAQVAVSAQLQGGLYLFAGPDRYRKRERVQAFTQALAVQELDTHQLNATHLEAASLAELIREYPGSSRLRLIVIEEASHLERACLKILEEQHALLGQTACVILLVDEELDASHPLWSLQSHATIEPFPWLSRQDLIQWVSRSLADHEKRMAASAIHDLLEGFGADLGSLRVILDQLIAWAGPRSLLTQDDVRLFVEAPAADNDFAVVQAIARRDVARALKAVEERLADGEEELRLLGLVASQIQRWLRVSHLMGAGLSREQIGALTGITPWQLERVQAELVGRSLPWLREALEQCWRLDGNAKRGKVPNPRLALEHLVIELCLPQPPRAGALGAIYSSKRYSDG